MFIAFLCFPNFDRSRITRTAVLFLFAAALGGCRTGTGRNEIAVIPLFATENLASCEHVGMDEAIAHTNLHLHFNGPSDGDAQRQIDLLNEAIARRDLGIVIDPRSLHAANGAIHEALGRDVPIVVLLHRLPLAPQVHLSFVVEDVGQSAQLAAERLHEVLPGKSEVLLVGLDSLSPGGEDRFDAVEDALAQTAPDLRVVKRIVGPPLIGYFRAAIQQALVLKPGLRGIIALDSHAGYAAAAVVHELHAEQRIHILAFDQNTEVLASLRQGGVDAVVAQDMRQIGKLAIANIVKDRKGESVPNITYIKPMLVTRENIDTEDVQRILQMNWVQP
jgi:ribose transport system substrate-binding protein